MKYCVYTRSFFENIYLTYFIKHYINLGFDKIIIIHSGGSKYDLSEEYAHLVDIHYVGNLGDGLLPTYDYLIKNTDFDWVLSVDIDELLLLNENYNNINDYVQEKLILNNNINAFYFRWGMIEKCDIDDNNNFSYILSKYKIFSNPHIKTMFKKNDLITVNHAHFAILNNLTIYFENNIVHDNNPFPSTNENSYKEHILIHLHTRSLHNLVLKSLNTIFDNKRCQRRIDFIEFINNLDPNLSDDTVMSDFLEYIGLKASLPFAHGKSELVQSLPCNISKYDYEITDSNLNVDILNCLKINNINENNYLRFIGKLSEVIINNKTFIIDGLE